ncbi:hypothetical protein EP331_02790 [bacterium]|nr:MAG: hypothetical protein EP331_02790 [bacterium]
MTPIFRPKQLLTLLISAVFINSCALLNQAAKVEKPKVVDWKVKLTGISFDAVKLDYKMKLANNNPVGVKLSNYTYSVKVEEQNLVSGTQNEGIQLNANDTAWVSIPLSFTYKELYNIGKSYVTSDSVNLAFKTDFGLDIPVLGKIQVPFETDYSIPVIKRPKVSIGNFSMESISLMGAKFNLKLKVDNPNSLGIDLGKIGFDFKVNGKSWFRSAIEQGARLTPKGTTEFNIPIGISFSDVSLSMINSIRKGEPFDYEIIGDVDVKLPLFDSERFTVPIKQAGSLKLNF